MPRDFSTFYKMWFRGRGRFKKGGFRGVEKGVFVPLKRGFLGGRKGGFLRRGGGAADFCACLKKIPRVLLKFCRVFEGG